jgi:capsular exopolysaccharide synthesis family protein
MNDLSSRNGTLVAEPAAVPADGAWIPVATTTRGSIIAQYIKIARRWKWVIIAGIAAGIAAALVITLLMTRQYSATVTIEIAREEARIVNVQGVEPSQVGSVDDEFYQTQYGLLVSRSLAERVARELRLADNQSFLNMYDIGDTRGSLSESRPLDNSATARTERTRLVTAVLLNNVTITPTRMSRLVKITYANPDPALAAQIANAWARLFIRTNIERRFEATSYARDFLERRLAELRQRLDQSERELVRYAESQNIINISTPTAGGLPSERPIAADDLVNFNAALAQATQDRMAAESAARAGNRNAGATMTGLNNNALNVMRQQRAAAQAEAARLRAQFGPDYPPVAGLTDQLRQMDRAIAAEESRVSASLQSQYEQARAREQTLSQRVEALKGGLLDLRRRSIQYNILQREVSTSQTLYDGLLQRYKEIGVAGGVGTNNVSIVDDASIPSRPSSPRPLINILLGMLAGTVAGVGLSLVLDQIDEKITDPLEMEKALGIPGLGVVPKFEGENPLEELENRRSALTEAYLTVKTNLQFATASGVPRSLLVTSTRAGEGKSTTLFALALVLARQGRKVVIVDADMRSPSLHHLFNLENGVGLSSLLTNNATWQEAVQDSGMPGVKAITAGPHPPNAADLLSGRALETLIQGLNTEFDHVLVDAPPLLGLADAPLIASKVEGAVFVVEAYGVESRSAKTAIDRLRSSGARVLGAVLTKFDSRKASYGYGYDYGYGYGMKDRTAANGHEDRGQ